MSKQHREALGGVLLAIVIAGLVSLATCAAGGGGSERSTDPPSAEQQPIYVTLAFHLDVPFPWDSGPTPETATIAQIVDELTARGLRAHLGFQATVAEQLAWAFPDTVAQIQAAQMPVAYHVWPRFRPPKCPSLTM